MIKKVHIFDVFRNAMMNDPDGSRDDQFNAFLEEVKENPKYIKALAEDYFYRMYAQWKVDKEGKSHTLAATPATERRAELSAEKRKERAEQVTQKAVEIANQVRRIVLLDLPMPNGKKLRDCTFSEVGKFGNWMSELATHGKPTQVISHRLNEKEVQNIYSRYETAKRRNTASAELRA